MTGHYVKQKIYLLIRRLSMFRARPHLGGVMAPYLECARWAGLAMRHDAIENASKRSVEWHRRRGLRATAGHLDIATYRPSSCHVAMERRGRRRRIDGIDGGIGRLAPAGAVAI